MFCKEWLSPLSPYLRRPARGRTPSRQRFRPHIEELESRYLLATLHVTSILDDGSAGTLRQAVGAANPGDVILFDPSGTGTIQLTSTLSIAKSMTITGPLAGGVTLNGGDRVEVLNIGSFAAVPTVILQNLTVTGGRSARGGAISNTGVLTVDGCTFVGNQADGNGGGIANQFGGNLTLTNCTIVQNVSLSSGGGVFSDFGSTLTVANCTITSNTAAAGGGIFVGFNTPPGAVSLTNTIVAQNTAPASPDLGGNFPSVLNPLAAANNFIGDGIGSGLTDGIDGNQVGSADNPIDPQLGLLQDNGGPTQTLVPLAGSPVLDRGSNAFVASPPFIGPPFTDQRGQPRIENGTVDIGAVEDPAPTATTLTSDINPSIFGQTVTFTATVSAAAGTPTGIVDFETISLVRFIGQDGPIFRWVITTLGTGTLDGSGNATFQTNGLGVGNTSVTAVYEGDGDFGSGTSNPYVQMVEPAVTNTIVTSDANPSIFGQLVTFTATVTNTSDSATPDGSVEFFDGAVDLGPGSVLAGSGNTATATFATSTLSPGPHAIIAQFTSSGEFVDSDNSATPFPQIVKAVTTTGVTSNNNPSNFGQPVTFTATVTNTSDGSTPTGAVEFFDGAADLGPGSALAGSGNSVTATFATSTLSPGPHAIIARYTATGNFVDSDNNAAPFPQVVKAVTTTSVTSSINPSFFGQPVTFTARVTNINGGAAPTGSVEFFDGATDLGPGNALAGSGNIASATFATSILLPGLHAIIARYTATGNFVNSDNSTAPFPQLVKAVTTTAVTSSINPSIFGQPVTFTATVTNISGGAAPTGSVEFFDGATDLGPGNALAGSGNTATATFATSILLPGPHAIIARYTATGNFVNSDNSAGPFPQFVKAATTTSVTSSINPSFFGQPVTFTARVTNISGGAPPTGNVEFFDGAIDLGPGSALAGGGNTATATFATSILLPGPHAIIARYTATGNFANSDNSAAPFPQIVKAITTTAVASNNNPSIFGQPVTFTATITNTNGGTPPTGNVEFFDGAVDLGPGSALAGSGNTSMATFATSTLSPGPHALIARYTATGNFVSSDNSAAPFPQIVKAVTTTAVTSNNNPSIFGQPVTFTATVTDTSGGAGPTGSAAPTGSVEFFDGTTDLGPGDALAGGGNTVTATFTTSTLLPGPHAIIAHYTATGNFVNSDNSAAPFPQIVKAVTTTAVTSNNNPSNFGQPVTFTATVTNISGGAAPTGSVEFFDGAVDLGPGSALAGSGNTATATFATSTLSPGPHALIARYTATGNFVNSDNSAAPFPQIVRAVTTTAVTSSINPSIFGQPVTFTATVVNTSGSAAPTGSIEFFDGATDLGPGSALADGGNTGTATFTTSTLLPGPHTIIAHYTATGNFADSDNSAAPFPQIVDAVTATSVTSSINPSIFGQRVTFTATVINTSGGAAPTGSVEFFDGATDLGPGSALAGSGNTATATFATSTLLPGPHALIARYTATGNFVNSDNSAAPFPQIVKAVTTTGVTSSNNPSIFGQPVTFTATVTDTSGGAAPTGSVEFFDGATDLGPGSALTGSGNTVTSTFATSILSPGPHALIARYTATGNFANSDNSATPFPQIVDAVTVTSVTSSINPSIFGQRVTFTATVTNTSGGASPTGSVEFFDGATDLGPGSALAGSDNTVTATFATSTLLPGAHAIIARYTATGNFVNSDNSAAPFQQIVKAVTTTAVASNNNPSIFGQPVTFTATVTDTSGGAAPTGSVEFFDGATDLGPGSALVSSGNTVAAIFTTWTLLPGPHAIIARYTATGNFVNSDNSAAPFPQFVKAATTTAVTSSSNPSIFGEPVTFTATVTDTSGSAAPTGSVEFFDGATDLGPGSALAGSGNNSATSTFTTTTLAVSPPTHSITAVYAGNANFTSSSSPPLIQTVNMADTQTTVASEADPAALGRPVTFTAAISVLSPGGGTPSGSVQFTLDSVPQAPISLSGGQARFTPASLTPGPHIVLAVYSGDANFNGSTAQPFDLLGTTTTVSSSVNPSMEGELVTFTAIVSPAVATTLTPTGTVEFFDGATEIGSGSLVPNGAFSLVPSGALSLLPSGAFSLGPNDEFSLTPDGGAFGVVPNDELSLKPNGAFSLLPNGEMEATFTTSALGLSPPAHSITAIYIGGPNFNGSTSPPLIQTVEPAAPPPSEPSSSTPAQTVQSGPDLVGSDTSTVVRQQRATSVGKSGAQGNATQAAIIATLVSKQSLQDVDITQTQTILQTNEHAIVVDAGNGLGSAVIFAAAAGDLDSNKSRVIGSGDEIETPAFYDRSDRSQYFSERNSSDTISQRMTMAQGQAELFADAEKSRRGDDSVIRPWDNQIAKNDFFKAIRAEDDELGKRDSLSPFTHTVRDKALMLTPFMADGGDNPENVVRLLKNKAALDETRPPASGSGDSVSPKFSPWNLSAGGGMGEEADFTAANQLHGLTTADWLYGIARMALVATGSLLGILLLVWIVARLRRKVAAQRQGQESAISPGQPEAGLPPASANGQLIRDTWNKEMEK